METHTHTHSLLLTWLNICVWMPEVVLILTSVDAVLHSPPPPPSGPAQVSPGSAGGPRERLEPAPDPPQTPNSHLTPPSKAAVDGTASRERSIANVGVWPLRWSRGGGGGTCRDCEEEGEERLGLGLYLGGGGRDGVGDQGCVCFCYRPPFIPPPRGKNQSSRQSKQIQ